MDPPHFHFGFHPEHGFVAKATAGISRHLAEWYLTREQFEPLPGAPDLYRLARPEQDGMRRSRQAVTDLRAHGFTIQTDPALDPELTPTPRQPAWGAELSAGRSRLAQAASARSPQRGMALTTEHTAKATPNAGRPHRPARTAAIGAPQRLRRGR